jgi:Ser/Thr protein kinase RdoA (MazF antagonist)
MQNESQTAYQNLTPDCVLDALESVGIQGDGRLLALNSYENRVYLIGVEGGESVVAKFYRPHRWSNDAILEEHAFLAELVAKEIPAVPALSLMQSGTLHEYSGFRFSVFPRQGGRAPELDDSATRQWLGRFIGRIHVVGANKTFHHRPTLDIKSFGEEPLAYLLTNNFLPTDLETPYRTVAQQALDGVRRCFDRAGKVPSIRLHGDCHGGNVLWTEAGPHFVDFDDSRMGPPIQDIWMLLSGSRSEMVQQLGDILAGYTDFCEFDARQMHLMEGLRTLRLIHYSAWIARRWEDPAFPLAFPWFNTQRYWQDRILELHEQIAMMDEPPLEC